jgi:hypothetical protein
MSLIYLWLYEQCSFYSESPSTYALLFQCATHMWHFDTGNNMSHDRLLHRSNTIAITTWALEFISRPAHNAQAYFMLTVQYLWNDIGEKLPCEQAICLSAMPWVCCVNQYDANSKLNFHQNGLTICSRLFQFHPCGWRSILVNIWNRVLWKHHVMYPI